MSKKKTIKISITNDSIDIITKDIKDDKKEFNSNDNNREQNLDNIGHREIIDQEKLQKQYIKYMDNVVEHIKNMKYGDKILVEGEPHIKRDKKRYCSIIRNTDVETYIFYGIGSKKILRYFMEKTKNDKEHGYNNIIQILDSQSHRQFLPIKCLKTFWNKYKNEPIKNRYIFEVILSDRPCKPYLDIEWKENSNKTKNKYKLFIDKITNDLILIFSTRYNIPIDESNILISTSHSISKVSFHIVINKIHNDKVVVYDTNKKGYSNSAWDLWHALTEHNNNYKKIIDESVYSTDREFRTLYSNKLKEFRPIVPYGTNVKENSSIKLSTKKCMLYFVTHLTDDKLYFIKTPVTDGKYMVINKKNIYDICPQKFYTDEKVKELIQLIKPYHETVEYMGTSPCGKKWRFNYRNKEEPCYTGNTHTSNGFYVYENVKNGYLYMKCFSSKCTNKIVINKNNISKKMF